MRTRRNVLAVALLLSACGENAEPENPQPATPPAASAPLFVVVDAVGASAQCAEADTLISAYCFADAGRSVSASGPALQADASGRITASCLTGGRNLRLVCAKSAAISK